MSQPISPTKDTCSRQGLWGQQAWARHSPTQPTTPQAPRPRTAWSHPLADTDLTQPPTAQQAWDARRELDAARGQQAWDAEQAPAEGPRTLEPTLAGQCLGPKPTEAGQPRGQRDAPTGLCALATLPRGPHQHDSGRHAPCQRLAVAGAGSREHDMHTGRKHRPGPLSGSRPRHPAARRCPQGPPQEVSLKTKHRIHTYTHGHMRAHTRARMELGPAL